MKLENRGTMLALLSRCTVFVAGIAGLSLFAACSPVPGESEETADGSSVDLPAENARTNSPSIGAPSQNAALVKGIGNTVVDCAVNGTCPDLSCTEPGRYRIEGGVVVDLKNNLRLWQRDFASGLDYAEATAYCAGLKLNGVSGWRIPDGGEEGG